MQRRQVLIVKGLKQGDVGVEVWVQGVEGVYDYLQVEVIGVR